MIICFVFPVSDVDDEVTDTDSGGFFGGPVWFTKVVGRIAGITEWDRFKLKYCHIHLTFNGIITDEYDAR